MLTDFGHWTLGFPKRMRPADRFQPAGRFTVQLTRAACGTTHEADDPGVCPLAVSGQRMFLIN